LGRPPIWGPGDTPPDSDKIRNGLPLVDLPAELAAHGIHTLEICHFHLPSRDETYLATLRSALDSAGVELFSLLVDGGDITDPQVEKRDMAWIKGWLDIAATLGAGNARIIAGKQPPSADSLARSRRNLKILADYAKGIGVRVMTENWLDTFSTPEAVCTVMNELDGRVGLCVDFGNWRGATKYGELAEIFQFAESCHAKCHSSATGEFERDDFLRCLDLAAKADFQGPYTLIYDGQNNDEWSGIGQEMEMVRPYL
jgi:sugar phosphate isomerase/epimerase